MKHIIKRHAISFKHAFDGIIWAFSTQPNFVVHLLCSLLAIWLSIYLKISRMEMIIILFTIMIGFTGEMINTAIESVTDLITNQWRKEAKIAKDVSAGMMLLIAIGTVVIASYIFIPYIVSF